jgi:beta-phosphoglucomutase family hydrolase
MDGVLTRTATVHDQAWKATFDAFLKERAEKTGEPFVPFDPVKDYDEYVDGKPRADGVRSFLASRHISLPEAEYEALARRKDAMFLKLIHEHGVATYEGSIRYVKAARKAGLKTAVVSSSKNTTEVLRAAAIHDLFDGQVDGNLAESEGLKGKPAPDTYLRAARMLGTSAAEAAVYEDALAGVEAGRAGGFALVVGVDRAHQAAALKAHGADVVVEDLAELIQAN